MPQVKGLIKGENPRYQPWIVSEEELGPFTEWARNIPGFGTIQISTLIKTSYAQTLEFKGEENFIAAVKDTHSDQYCGMCLVSKKEVAFGDKIEKTAYLSSLYVEPRKRKGVIFGLLFRMLPLLTNDCTGCLVTVMADNEEVVKILQLGKGGSPVFKDLGFLHTLVFHPRKIASFENPEKLEISTALPDDIKALTAFWKREMANRLFSPHYLEKHIATRGGLLRGLNVNDFFIARAGGQIVGSIAVWNQNATKSWVVKSYPPMVKIMRLLINLFAKFRGVPTLPSINEPLDYRMIALLCINENDPHVLRALLNMVKKHFQHHEQPVLAMGLHERDPLLKSIHFPYFLMKSKVLFALTPSDTEYEATFENLVPYLELGSL
ncbi:MAG: hypothetical protein DWQ02_26840 [Bacteroidetes bacterium]|nr:MAG: hypothetical protein DWQ02_26840 [Bacteroidota bacterium]